MGFFKKLMKNVKDQAMQDQSVSIERLPTEPKGISSMLGGKKKQKGFMPLPVDLTPVDPRPAPVPTGIEALIRPPRTDPGGQEDMRKLMDMQRQTFRSFLAPPPAVKTPTIPYLPIDGGDLGLPTGPGTPMPPGTIFEGEVGQIDIQDILDSLPKGVGVGGIGSIPVPDIPYEIPQITVPVDLPKLPFDLPIDLPIQVPPVEDFVMPSLPVELPIDFNTYEKVPDINIQMPNPLDSVPASLPLQLPQIENIGIPAIQLPLEIPTLPQVAMMPSVSPVSMPAMKMARFSPSMVGIRER